MRRNGGRPRAGGPRARHTRPRRVRVWPRGHDLVRSPVTSRPERGPDACAPFSATRDVGWADGRARADKGGRSCTRPLPASACGALFGAAGREDTTQPPSRTHTGPNAGSTQAGQHVRWVTVTVTCRPPVFREVGGGEKEAGRARCAPSTRESRGRASEGSRRRSLVARSCFAARLPSCSRSPLQAELAALIGRAR